MDKIKQNREFFKADFETLKNIKTDKQKGILAPSFQKEYDPNSDLIELPPLSKDILKKFNGVNEKSLVYSALEHIRILEDLNYNNMKISIEYCTG